MEPIRNVELQFKCNKSQNDFEKNEEGYFCSQCNKNVYDFSNKSLDDLLQFFETRGSNFCGGFSEAQLKPRFPWSRIITAALLFLGVQIPSQATAQQKNQLATCADTSDIKDFGGFAEVLPRFPGGDMAFGNYIQKNLQVPSGTPEGRVVLSFVVDRTGSLRDITVLKGLSKKADAEAIRVVSQGPKWSPGVYMGRPVNLKYTIPIHFRKTD